MRFLVLVMGLLATAGAGFSQNLFLDNALVRNDIPLFSDVSMLVYLKDHPKTIVSHSFSTERKSQESVLTYTYEIQNGEVESHRVVLEDGRQFEYIYKYNSMGLPSAISVNKERLEISYTADGNISRKVGFYDGKVTSEQDYFYNGKFLERQVNYSIYGTQKFLDSDTKYFYSNDKVTRIVSEGSGKTLDFSIANIDRNVEYIAGNDRQMLRFFDKDGRILQEIVWYLSQNWSVKYENTKVDYDSLGRVGKVVEDSTYLDQGSSHQERDFEY